MRITTVFRRLLGVTGMYVEEVLLTEAGDLAIGGCPSWRRSRCGECGRRAPRYDRKRFVAGDSCPWVGSRCTCCTSPGGFLVSLTAEALRQGGANHSQTLRWHPRLRHHSPHNGLVEGLNGKLRLVARRAYGFHSPQPPSSRCSSSPAAGSTWTLHYPLEFEETSIFR